jgi:hypothetical protein
LPSLRTARSLGELKRAFMYVAAIAVEVLVLAGEARRMEPSL